MLAMMLAGPPGPLVDALRDFVAANVAAEGGTLEMVHALPAGEPEPSGATSQLHVCAYPDAATRLMLRAAPLKLVLALDDAAASFARLRRLGYGTLDAIRQLTACDAVLGSIAQPDQIRLTRDNIRDPAALKCGLGIANGGIALPPTGDPPPSADEMALLDAVLPGGLAFARTGIRHAVTWPLACLLSGDRPGEPAAPVVELAGPARVLIYGPYYHLPTGNWRAQVRLRFSSACAGAWFALELHGSGMIGRCQFRVEQEGIFAATFVAYVPSADEPIEVRLVLERGAIEGELALLDIALEPMD